MRPGLPASLVNELDNLPAPYSQYRGLAERALERLFYDAAMPIDGERIFISTGDIPAMWLRDSSFQVKPLIRFSGDQEIYRFVSKVIAAQSFFIAIDPYANAFNAQPNSNCWKRDFEDQSPWVFERKWEVDSLISHLQVSLDLYQVSGQSLHLNQTWWRSVVIILDTLERETNHDSNSYRFLRSDAPVYDFLSHDGYGAPFRSAGLIWSGFRPSDDACTLPFNIPQNAYASAQLRRLASVANGEIAARALSLAATVSEAITNFGLIDGMYAYEVDCLGSHLMMDDANIPSLLSLPYLDYCSKDDETYLKTRSFVLSEANPWFFTGSKLAHIGSQHTGPMRAWPLALAMEIITSKTKEPDLMANLVRTASPNGALHESISVNDLADFTREWFSWAEMTFVDALFASTSSKRI